MAPASFPEIESPSLRKSGVVLESEELRPSAIGQTGRDVGHATTLLNDEFFFDCDGRTENITFRERGQLCTEDWHAFKRRLPNESSRGKGEGKGRQPALPRLTRPQ